MTQKIEAALRSHVDIPVNVNRRIRCPECADQRRNKRDRSLSLKREDDKLLYNCWHCNTQGSLPMREQPAPKAIAKIPPPGALTANGVKYLKSRGISVKTANKYGVYSTVHYFRKLGRNAEALVFPYTNQGHTYACKVRCIEEKDHSQIGACQTLWGLDKIEDLDNITIVEGELDLLAAVESGITNVVSVPGGAPSQQPTDIENDRRFQFLIHAEEILDQVDSCYLAGDKDKPGEILIEELARRIGKHKCWRVTWPGIEKDANGTLIAHGTEAVKAAWDNAERFPVAGLFEPETFFDSVNRMYGEGAGSGKSTGYYNIDTYFTVVPGTLNVVTGIPQSGKSEFLDQLAIKIADREDWPIAIISPENEPDFHLIKLIQKKVGKHFFVGNHGRMSREELEQAQRWINQRFVFGYQADGSLNTVDSIIERLKVAVVRNGIRMAIVDPVNYIERPSNANETQWVSDMLSQFRAFAGSHGVALFLVAHPQKLYRGNNGEMPIPTGYDVSGSAHFFNKADMGLTVHRPNWDEDDDEVEVHVWKCRHTWAGKRGVATLHYDLKSTRYYE